MARHDDDDHHDDHHGDHAHDEERISAELLVDRERMFGTFVSFTAWNLVIIFAILALLALTQT